MALDADGNAFISFRSSTTLKLAKVVKTNPGFYISNPNIPFTGTPQAAIVYGYDGGVVNGVVSNIRYNGSTTRPTNPGTYAVTANFAPDDILNFNNITNGPAGDFVIQAEKTLNGGLNTYPTATSKIPTSWKAVHFSPTDGKNTTSKKEGTASVKISGNGSIKTLTQTRSLSGGSGDIFTFYFWVRGASIPSSGICRGQVLFYNGTSLVETHTIICNTGTFPFTKKTDQFAVTHPYTKVAIKLMYTKSSGSVWFDAVGLFR